VSPPDLPGYPGRNRREPDLAAEQAARDEAARLDRAVAQVPKPTPIRIERAEEPPVSTNPWSMFPAAEAAKAKVSVSVLLLLAVPAVTYWVGSTRHQEKLQELSAKVQELKLENASCAKATRVEELMNNLSREQATTGGRVQQMNGDIAVIYSHVTAAQKRAKVAAGEPTVE
jgi:uncharacterized protein HemX